MFYFLFKLYFLVPLALLLPFHYPSYKDKFFLSDVIVLKIVHLCFRKIKNTHTYRVIYSLILWMATRLSLKILLFTNVDFELYFNNFFHQLWVWYLPFCEWFSIVLPNTLSLISLKNLFKWISGCSSFLCVKINILLQPSRLIEL